MTTAVLAIHVWLDEKGVAWIDDTNVKVVEVVLDKTAYGWSPEEIFFQHYGDLSLAQIHAALAYYYDHQEEIDAQIQKDSQEYERLRLETKDQLTRAELESRLRRK